jgi:hypothetical protein
MRMLAFDFRLDPGVSKAASIRVLLGYYGAVALASYLLDRRMDPGAPSALTSAG